MATIAEDMNAAIAVLENKLTAGGVTVDQVNAQIHSVVDPAISDLNTKLAAIIASDADAASKLADVTTAVSEFTVAFAPAAPAPTPEAPPAPAPEAAPAEQAVS